MHIIDDDAAFSRALDSPIDPRLRRLLEERRDQLLSDTGGDYELGELARFIVVEPHDTIADIEAAAGYPVVTTPAFEWVADHGNYFEAVTVLADDGFGVVLFVPDSEGVDPVLLSLLRSHANSSPADIIERSREERPTAS